MHDDPSRKLAVRQLRRFWRDLVIAAGVASVVFIASVLTLVYVHLGWGNLRAGPVVFAPPSSYGMNLVLSTNGLDAYVTQPALDRVLVLDARSGQVVAAVPDGDTPTGLAISPDGKQLWVVDTGLEGGLVSAVSVVSTSTLRVVAIIPLRAFGGAVDVAFSPSGDRAYVTENGIGAQGRVDVIDVATRRVVAAISPRGDGAFDPTSVAVAPDGEVWVSEADVLAGSPEGSTGDILAFDPRSFQLRARIVVGTGAFFMALSRDGRFAYVADKESCQLQEVDTRARRIVATVRVPPADGCPYGIAAADHDGAAYFATGRDHTLELGAEGNRFGEVDFTSGRIVFLRATGVDPVTVATAPGLGTAYVVDASRPAVYAVDEDTGALLRTWHLPGT